MDVNVLRDVLLFSARKPYEVQRRNYLEKHWFNLPRIRKCAIIFFFNAKSTYPISQWFSLKHLYAVIRNFWRPFDFASSSCRHHNFFSEICNVFLVHQVKVPVLTFTTGLRSILSTLLRRSQNNLKVKTPNVFEKKDSMLLYIKVDEG